MTRLEAWSLHAANVLVGGTGVVYAWMRYLLPPADEFAVVNHPQQPLVQHLHVLLAPLAVFAVGVVWRAHVWTRVRSGFRPRRWTGLTLAAGFAPMVVSGYLLQVAGDPTWRRVWIVAHVASSLLWLLGYGAHLVAKRGAAAGGA